MEQKKPANPVVIVAITIVCVLIVQAMFRDLTLQLFHQSQKDLLQQARFLAQNCDEYDDEVWSFAEKVKEHLEDELRIKYLGD